MFLYEQNNIQNVLIELKLYGYNNNIVIIIIETYLQSARISAFNGFSLF